ncbi:nuclease-related domain-containing protein [Neobacillus niacini]|uniref:nuclease-related domain-containing protein n=1 Tax=Neobacillus niacini TaxID=86668 RepID=UPI000A418060|nr:nuclease-related domain-containing protein [Neobacillus niacini]
MLIKPRSESDLLKIMRILNARMNLNEDEKKQYLYLKKGYEGEVAFDLLTASNLNSEIYILNDIMLERNNSKFQIDTVMIVQNTIFPCEVKNYEGDYYYQNDEFNLCKIKKPISNPLHQLKRSETMLREYLQDDGFHFHIEPYLIFINPGFFLYQAPQNNSIIFPSQLSCFMKKLNSKPSKLNGMHRKLADKLTDGHTIDSPYPKLPPYNYHSLQKGLTCGTCNSPFMYCCERKATCNHCGYEEEVESAVVRSVGEFKLLFPDLKSPLILFMIGAGWSSLER